MVGSVVVKGGHEDLKCWVPKEMLFAPMLIEITMVTFLGLKFARQNPDIHDLG